MITGRFAVLLVSMVVLVGQVDAAPAPTRANVKYGAHERNILDFWQARSDKPAPLLIFIHGGGFKGGDKSQAWQRHSDLIDKCLASGVSFAAINYRYLEHAQLPQIMRDGARALQFLRANAADLNIDPARIGSFGGSAGAGMSLWLGAHDDLADPKNEDPVLRQSTRLSVVGMLNGQCTYNVGRWPQLIGPSPEKAGSAADAAATKLAMLMGDLDMLAMLSKDDPPVFMYCSMPDTPAKDRNHYVHHPRHSKAVEARCKELGIEAMFLDNTQGDKQAQALSEFMIGHLKPKK